MRSGQAGPKGAAGTTYTHVFGETPSGTINGINTVFTLAHEPTAGVAVYVAGLRLVNTAYALAASTLTWVVAPAIASVIQVDYVY